MKKLILALIVVCSFAGAKAQNYQQTVKINPLSLFLATGNVSYERKVTENQTFQLGAFYSGVKISGLRYSGFGFTPEYRFYFAGQKQAMNGVYAAPFARVQSFTLKDVETKEKANYTSFGGGAILGWEKTWRSGFVLDLFVGPSFNNGKVKNTDNEDEFDVSAGFSGFGVRTGITLGFAF